MISEAVSTRLSPQIQTRFMLLYQVLVGACAKWQSRKSRSLRREHAKGGHLGSYEGRVAIHCDILSRKPSHMRQVSQSDISASLSEHQAHYTCAGPSKHSLSSTHYTTLTKHSPNLFAMPRAPRFEHLEYSLNVGPPSVLSATRHRSQQVKAFPHTVGTQRCKAC